MKPRGALRNVLRQLNNVYLIVKRGNTCSVGTQCISFFKLAVIHTKSYIRFFFEENGFRWYMYIKVTFVTSCKSNYYVLVGLGVKSMQ